MHLHIILLQKIVVLLAQLQKVVVVDIQVLRLVPISLLAQIMMVVVEVD